MTRLPMDQWLTLIQDAHPGYIHWQNYQDNLRRLQANAQAYGADRRQGPAREGPALLQGLILCGVCGTRMTVHYHRHGARLVPEYCCQARVARRDSDPACQSFCGDSLDRAIGNLLI